MRGVTGDRLPVANGKNLNESISKIVQEIWKDIEGFEGLYQVSNIGRVRSLDRYITRSDGIVQFKRGVVKKPKNSTDGYNLITLSNGQRVKTIAIHILVAKHFIENPNNLPEVNHKDFDRKNNCVDNLEWCTHKDNVRHSSENGRYRIRDFNGKNNPNYGNHTLKDFYARHPEKALELLARHGAQNGNAKAVKMYDANHNHVKTFTYIGECAQYLIDNQLCKATKINYIRDRICKASNRHRLYVKHYFEICNKDTA